MLRVDCHFHPNLPFLLGESFVKWRAKMLWETFRKRRLDAVFVSEHSFKHPVRSFLTLQKYKPAGHRTQIIPAVEALTKEGIDVIVFSKDRYVYTCRDVITPYKLTVEQLVDRIHRDPRLYGVIAHPRILSDSGILHHRSEKVTLREERSAHGVEKYNASLIATLAVLTAWHLKKLLKRTVRQIKETSRLPARLTPKGVMLLGGSDAHHTWDLGACLLIHIPKQETYHQLFRAIVSPGLKRTFSWKHHRHPLVSIVIDAVTSYREHVMRKLKLYRVDVPVMVTRNEA